MLLFSLFSRRGACRDVSLEDFGAQVFGIILLKRFQSERDQRTRHKQSDFGPGRGCTDQMHKLRRTLEQRWSSQQATIMLLLRSTPWIDTLYCG